MYIEVLDSPKLRAHLKWPHGKVLEASRRGWELIAKSIVLHVNPDKIIESWSREAENARDLPVPTKLGGKGF
jgi:hypothetical protein